MDIVERLRESDNDTEYVSPIGNERRLTLAWEAAEEIERLRERVAYLEGCQCKACKDGVKHWSDCAVHNGDALPVSQCDCGVVATPNVEVQGPGAASLRTVPCNDGLGAWRPISTAPKDGTEILVYTWAGSFYVVTYDDLYSAPWRVRNDEGIAEQAPAFWQPLPKAPNVEFSGTPAALSPEAPLECRVGGAVPPAPTFGETT